MLALGLLAAVRLHTLGLGRFELAAAVRNDTAVQNGLARELPWRARSGPARDELRVSRGRAGERRFVGRLALDGVRRIEFPADHRVGLGGTVAQRAGRVDDELVAILGEFVAGA